VTDALLQTTVPAELAEYAKLRAAEEHISTAAWLRQLIAADHDAHHQRGLSDRAARAHLVVAASVAVLPGLMSEVADPPNHAKAAIDRAEALVQELVARGHVP
jgi:hypothetical protein